MVPNHGIQPPMVMRFDEKLDHRVLKVFNSFYAGGLRLY